MSKRSSTKGKQSIGASGICKSDGENNFRQSDLDKILQILRLQTGVDFSYYKKSTLTRRIARRMSLRRVERLTDYVALVGGDANEAEALFNDVLINVTSFFRDSECFSALAERVLPFLMEKRLNQGGDLRIWVPGCSTGEEVYSLAILVLEYMEKKGAHIRVQLFGTDLSEAAIAKARAGFYLESSMKNVSEARLRRFFTKTDNRFVIKRNVRDLCTFARQNLCEDPPFSKLDLVSCRNLLIYLGPELQKHCIPLFHYALNPGGFLVLGNSESIGSFTHLFQTTEKKTKVYMRKTTRQSPPFGFARDVGARKPQWPKPEPVPGKGLAGEVQRQADLLLLNRFAPASVVIDEAMQILSFRGQTGPYLEHFSGEASLNLMQLARPSLAADLRTLVQKALKKGTPVQKEKVALTRGRQLLHITLEAIPIKLPAHAGQRWLLVLFSDHSTAAPVQKSSSKEIPLEKRSVERRLREELRATKESLEAIIEEQEASNEELKSANEEIESSNEELQSINQELETAKEELQSTNEELQTLNEELNNRNSEMVQANNDLLHLLAGIQIPIVMVDSSMIIRRVTPMAREAFNLIPSDIGRPFADIQSNLDLVDLEKLIGNVIETLKTCIRPVQDKGGRWHSLCIRPYRTKENTIDGALITLTDIDAIRHGLENRLPSECSIRAWVETMFEPVAILNQQLKLECANALFLRLFGISDNLASNSSVEQFAPPAFGSALKGVLADVLGSNGGVVRELPLPCELPGLGRRLLLVNASKLSTPATGSILLAIKPEERF